METAVTTDTLIYPVKYTELWVSFLAIFSKQEVPKEVGISRLDMMHMNYSVHK